MKKGLLFFTLIIGISSCSHLRDSNSDITIRSIQNEKWGKLNPARRDKSPLALTLWGDRNGEVPTGFLVKFVDGFSSPPHIHNVTYKGIVISGEIHNDDPKAANMWMPSNSFWTQPAGESHITSAKGKNNVAFIEIDSGPYLVKPVSKAFDNGERSYNIHASNILWKKKDGYKKAPLWKNKQGKVTGKLLSFKDSIKVKLKKNSKIVTISGIIRANNKDMNPGSFIEAKDSTKLYLGCKSKESCTIYLKK